MWFWSLKTNRFLFIGPSLSCTTSLTWFAALLHRHSEISSYLRDRFFSSVAGHVHSSSKERPPNTEQGQCEFRFAPPIPHRGTEGVEGSGSSLQTGLSLRHSTKQDNTKLLRKLYSGPTARKDAEEDGRAHKMDHISFTYHGEVSRAPEQPSKAFTSLSGIGRQEGKTIHIISCVQAHVQGDAPGIPVSDSRINPGCVGIHCL